MDGTQQRFYQLLEDASGVVGRCKEATGNAEPAEGYKRRQISELIEFAFKYNLWISFDDSSVIFLDKGGENEVFYDGASSVIKLNNFDYAGDDLENFLPESLLITTSLATSVIS